MLKKNTYKFKVGCIFKSKLPNNLHGANPMYNMLSKDNKTLNLRAFDFKLYDCIRSNPTEHDQNMIKHAPMVHLDVFSSLTFYLSEVSLAIR